MTEITKKKPAIYVLPGCSWGFVCLKELAEIAEMTPKRLLKNFFGLSKDVESMLVVVRDEIVRIAANGEVLNPDEVDFGICVPHVLYDWWDRGLKFHFRCVNNAAGEIFIPAGWAQDVLKAREQGLTGVILVCHTHQNYQETDCPKDTLTCTFMDGGFFSAVGTQEELPSETEEKEEDETEEWDEVPQGQRKTIFGMKQRYQVLREILNHEPWFTPKDLSLKQLQTWAEAMKVLMPINTENCEAQGMVPSQAALSCQWIVPLVKKGWTSQKIIEGILDGSAIEYLKKECGYDPHEAPEIY